MAKTRRRGAEKKAAKKGPAKRVTSSKRASKKKAAKRRPAKKAAKRKPAKKAAKKKASKKAVKRKPAKKAAKRKTAKKAAKRKPAKKAAKKKTAKRKPAKKAARKKTAQRKTAKIAKKKVAKKATAKKKAAPKRVAKPVDEAPLGYSAHEDARLTRRQLIFVYTKLVDEKTRKVAELERHMEEALGEAGVMPDETDMAQRHTEQAYLIRFADKERKLLNEIDRALEKLLQGSYGVCEGTEEPIGFKRLELRPWTRYSVAYKEQIERERSQHRR